MHLLKALSLIISLSLWTSYLYDLCKELSCQSSPKYTTLKMDETSSSFILIISIIPHLPCSSICSWQVQTQVNTTADELFKLTIAEILSYVVTRVVNDGLQADDSSKSVNSATMCQDPGVLKDVIKLFVLTDYQNREEDCIISSEPGGIFLWYLWYTLWMSIKYKSQSQL